mmetsp:Transcript_37656/g.83841  ORF Transcript_37656/g.83841 Transcript_37656/m.83841 type:complete len:546 (+) Transcript_37656:764-2401(+)
MPEVAHAGGEQHNSVLVAAVHGILVAQGAPRVHDGAHARLACNFHRVVPGEGEEGVTGQHGTLDLVTGLLQGDAHAVDPVGLPAAHTQQLAVLSHSDGVTLHVLHGPPCKLEVLQLLGAGLGLRHGGEGDLLGCQIVSVLVQPAARHLAQGQAAGGARLGLQDAQVLGLTLQGLQASRGVAGSNHDLVEHAGLVVSGGPELADLLGQLLIHNAIEGDNAAKRADGVGPDGQAVRLLQVLTAGNATGVGVLDNDAAGGGVVAHALVGGIGVQIVVVAHLLAPVHDAGGNTPGAVLPEGGVGVEGGLLVRVLPVPQGGSQLQRHRHHGGGAGAHLLPQPLRHLGVIAGAVLESLPGQVLAELCRLLAVSPCRQLDEQLGVVGGVHHHSHVGHVLRSSADHGGAADVNVLHTHLEGRGRVGGDGLAEGVQVHNHHVDRLDLVLLNGGHVLLLVTDGEDAAMHSWVQGLDAAIQHLWEAGHLLHLLDRNALLLDGGGCAAGGDDVKTQVMQALDQHIQVGLIRNRDQGSAASGHGGNSSSAAGCFTCVD